MNLDTAIKDEFLLTQRRVFNAPRDVIFRAWTDPQALKAWFGPEGIVTVSAEVDLRVGGAYCIGMRLQNGEIFYHRGVYQEVVENEKIVFTWLLEGQECDGCTGEYAETRVTVELIDKGGQTEVVLYHELLPSQEARDNHIEGWRGCFSALGRFIEEGSHDV